MVYTILNIVIVVIFLILIILQRKIIKKEREKLQNLKRIILNVRCFQVEKIKQKRKYVNRKFVKNICDEMLKIIIKK